MSIGRSKIFLKIAKVCAVLMVVWAVLVFWLDRIPIRAHSPQIYCISNLKQLDGAKSTWALEQKKSNTDTPQDTDLIGATLYIRYKLVCPAGGTYTLGKVSEKAKCNLAGHTL